MITERELAVLQLRSKGKTQAEIAHILKISQPAVSNFERAAKKKITGAKDLLEQLKKLGLLAFFLLLIPFFADDAHAVQYITPSNGANQSIGINDTLFIDNTHGYVGIGSATPNTALYVREENFTGTIATIRSTGATNNPGLFFLVDEPNSKSSIISSGTTGNLDLGIGARGVEVITVKGTGFVGINTTTPYALLTANGTVQITGAGTPTGGAGLELNYAPTFNGGSGQVTVYDRGGSVYKNLLFNAASHEFRVSGTQVLNINESGNVGIGTTSPNASLHLAQNTAASLRISRSGYTDAYIGLTNLNQVGEHTLAIRANSYDFRNDLDATLFAISEGGSVNITSPSAKLYVPEICLNGVCSSSWSGGVSSAGGWTNTSTLVSLSTSANNVSANTLFVDNTNSRVGIGTTTPDLNFVVQSATNSLVRIKGSSSGNYGAGLYFDVPSLPSSSSANIIMYDDDYSSVPEYADKLVMQTFETPIVFSAYGTTTNDTIQFYTGGRDAANRRITINQNGSVGINTTTPYYTFDTVGSVRFDGSTSDWTWDSAGGLTPGYLTGTLNINSQGLSNVDYISFITNPAGAGDIRMQNTGDIQWRNAANSADIVGIKVGADNKMLLMPGGGNVGIGTVSANGTLHLNASNANIIFEGDTTDDSDITSIVSLTSGDLAFRTNKTTATYSSSIYTKMTLTKAGHLGIGTVGPSARLHVASPTGDVSENTGMIIEGTGTGARMWQITPTASDTLLIAVPGLRVAAFGSDGKFFAGGLAGTSGAGAMLTANGTGVTVGTSYYGSAAPSNGMLVQGGVGIGTVSPSTKLHVNDTTTSSADVIRVESGADNVDEYAGISFRTAVGGAGPHAAIRVYNGPSANDAYISLLTTTDGGTLTQGLTQDHTGSIGIGTTTPNRKLTVEDSSGNLLNLSRSTLGSYFVDVSGGGADTMLLSFVANNAGAGYSFSSRNAGGTQVADALRIDRNGLVGVGLSAPTQKLDVAGNVQLNTSNNTINYIMTPAGQEIAIQAGAKGHTEYGVLNTIFSVKGGGYVQVNYTGAGTYQYDPYGEYFHMGYGGIILSNAGGFSGTNPLTLISSPGTSITGDVAIGSTLRNWHSSYSGAVLHLGTGATVFGHTASTSASHLAANYYINTTGSDVYMGSAPASDLYQDSGTMLFRVAPSGTAGNAISWTNALYINNTGYVGIGNTNPQGNLDVGAGGTGTAEAGIMINSGSGSGGHSILVFKRNSIIRSLVGVVGGNGGLITGSSADDLAIRNNGTIRFSVNSGTWSAMVINSSGNVGIGTIAPQAKLEVNNTLQLNNADQAGLGTHQGKLSFGLDDARIMNNPSGSGDTGDLQISNWNGGGYNTGIWLEATSGSVGINTTSPTFTLDITGSLRTTGGKTNFLADVGQNGQADNLEKGDLVSISYEATTDIQLGGNVPVVKLRKAIGRNDLDVVGVVFEKTQKDHNLSSTPGAEIRTGDWFMFATQNSITFLKASAENGPIVPGDYLTPANTPGYAMKADADSTILIGRSLDYLASGTDTINAFISISRAEGLTNVNAQRLEKYEQLPASYSQAGIEKPAKTSKQELFERIAQVAEPVVVQEPVFADDGVTKEGNDVVIRLGPQAAG